MLFKQDVQAVKSDRGSARAWAVFVAPGLPCAMVRNHVKVLRALPLRGALHEMVWNYCAFGALPLAARVSSGSP